MIKTIKLDNGLTLIYEKLEASRSVSIGYWVKVGSIDENRENNGISHFIEHMLFKGTKNRTAKDIAIEIDKIGGELNAFTSKECTCFYTTVLPIHVDHAIDVLADMLIESEFSEEEINREKTVIIEEINLYEDSPEDLIDDMVSEVIYKGIPLEMPIIGNIKTVESMTREKIVRYYNEFYGSKNAVLSVAGTFDEEELIKIVNEKFKDIYKGEENIRASYQDTFVSDFIYKKKDLEVNHYNICFDGVKYDSDDMYVLMILNNTVGGSVSSRLFQKIREDNGLAYSIDTAPNFYSDLGTFNISYSTVDKNYEKLTEFLINELNDLIENGITEEEMRLSKQQLISSYLLGLDGSNSYMSWLGKSMILSGRIKSEEEVLEKINKVTLEDLNNLIKLILRSEKCTVCVVGNTAKSNSHRLYEYIRNNLKG